MRPSVPLLSVSGADSKQSIRPNNDLGLVCSRRLTRRRRLSRRCPPVSKHVRYNGYMRQFLRFFTFCDIDLWPFRLKIAKLALTHAMWNVYGMPFFIFLRFFTFFVFELRTLRDRQTDRQTNGRAIRVMRPIGRPYSDWYCLSYAGRWRCRQLARIWHDIDMWSKLAFQCSDAHIRRCHGYRKLKMYRHARSILPLEFQSNLQLIIDNKSMSIHHTRLHVLILLYIVQQDGDP